MPDEEELQSETELVADLQAVSRAIQEDVMAGRSLTTWQLRRAEIAALRQRVRAIRARYLSGPDESTKHG